jgi:hypothetical protein
VSGSHVSRIGPASLVGLVHVAPPLVELTKPTLSSQVAVVQAASG